MTWARLEDNMPEHPKIAALSDGAFRLHIRAICYAARYGTDGEISAAAFRILGGRAKYASELVEGAVWDTTSRGGWSVHDFLEYNPSRREVEERRETRGASGRLGGQRSGEVRRQKAEANASPQSKQMLEAKSNPVPSRPVPSLDDEEDPLIDRSSSSSSVREIFAAALSCLPPKYQHDALTRDELEAFARDFPGQHRELGEAIAACRAENKLPFAGNLRRHMKKPQQDATEKFRNDPIAAAHQRAKAGTP